MTAPRGRGFLERLETRLLSVLGPAQLGDRRSTATAAGERSAGQAVLGRWTRAGTPGRYYLVQDDGGAADD